MATYTQQIVERRHALRNAGKRHYTMHRGAPLYRKQKQPNAMKELAFWVCIFVGFSIVGLMA